MSISGSRSAIDINLDEFERRLRIASAPQGQVDDPLSELARLVDEVRPAPISQVQQANPRKEDVKHRMPVELRSSFDEPESVPQQASAEPKADAIAAFAGYTPLQRAPSEFESSPHSKRRLLFASALAIAGVVILASVVALKYGMLGLPKKPPFIAALSGPTKIKPPSELTATTQNDSGTVLTRDNAKPTPVTIVNSEEQPVDLRAEASVGAIAKPPVDAAQRASNSAAVKATNDTPVVMASAGVRPATASQFPDSKPVRTIALRPDGTPIPAAAAAPTLDAQPSLAAEAPKASAKIQPQNRPDATASPQSSTPKIELPTKLSVKTSARIVVAKTDTTAPDGKMPPLQQGSISKAEKAKQAKTHEVAAVKPPAATMGSDSATKSDEWAVQLAAPSSESEAQISAQRLNAKYANALNGATIGIHKAVVKGATLYRLRIAGLSKADAAALCARLKGEGGDCFIAK